MTFSLFRIRKVLSFPTHFLCTQGFRSNAALEALAQASQDHVPNIVLYNYPSFSGAFSALFAHLYHSQLKLPCLILPFSSVEPLRVEDLCTEGLEKCYFLDFLGPKGFVAELSRRTMCQVIAFDHRKSVISKSLCKEDCKERLMFHVNVEKSSSTAAYEYFSARLSEKRSNDGESMSLLNSKEQDQVEMVLKYLEDADLRRWSLADIREFSVGLGEWRSKLNCITNPYMYKQAIWPQLWGLKPVISRSILNLVTTCKSANVYPKLMDINAIDLISKGNSQITTRQDAAKALLGRVFRVRLGRGLYGECLGVRADGNQSLSDEIAKELSIRSAEAGLRPIGAVIYMQRKNLKMCLRSTDGTTDTSEVAKAYGGGGSPYSSSFIIRMDEYNQWLSLSSS